jgi:hypothetical protein
VSQRPGWRHRAGTITTGGGFCIFRGGMELVHPRSGPFSFVACISNHSILVANLLRSPCLNGRSPNELIVVKNCPSAADGLNVGLERAKHEWIAFVHQDVYLPAGWNRLLAQQLHEAERRFGSIGVGCSATAPGCQRAPGRSTSCCWLCDEIRPEIRPGAWISPLLWS